jgi:HEAT repeat protein
VITSHRLSSLVAAGLVALFGAASPAVAHDAPAAPRPLHQPIPGRVTGEPGPQASSGVRSLRDLTGADRAVVLATVTRTDALDDQKLLVYRVTIERVLRGTPSSETVAVVDVRAGLTRPPLVTDGQRAVLLLAPAPSMSYLAQHLPGESPLYQLADGRDGVIPVGSEADVEVVVGLLDAIDRVRAEPDPAARASALRQLAFASLASDRPRLVANGLLELRRLPRDLSLTSEEISILSRVLRDTSIPAPTRIGLIRLLGQQRWAGALAGLQTVEADQPDVLAALLAARADLGAPPSRRDLAPYLASKDPAVRAAAVGALARLDEPGTIDELGRWAIADGDPTVRERAITALGESKRPEAQRYLRQTFASPDRTLMQASARALLALDEADGNAAFTELALHGSSSDVRRYAALVLLMTRGRQHPAVVQLLAKNPDPEVRRVIEHGIEMHDVHRHD